MQKQHKNTEPGHILLYNIYDEVAEWLRRWTANPLGSPRVGSNPILVVNFYNIYISLCVLWWNVARMARRQDGKKDISVYETKICDFWQRPIA